MKKRPRFFYAGGPGNIIGTYRHWKAGDDDPSEVSKTYSSQFWDICRESNAISFSVSSHPSKELVTDGDFRIEHRPRPWPGARGLRYHLAHVWYGLSLVRSALWFRADFAIIAEGSTHWFVLGILRILGVRIIPDMHCVLWPRFKKLSRTERILNRLNGVFFRSCVHAFLTVSSQTAAQVRELGGKSPTICFLPSYRRGLSGISKEPRGGCFRVLFAGRIEENKGVLDILKIASRFRAAGISGIAFDICGDGSALQILREKSRIAGLSESFKCHGHLGREAMKEMFGGCHVVLVPTRTDFREGFNRTVVEGVLAGRPVITSSVCPSLDMVGDAVLEVAPDDVNGYHDAILRLRGDSALYEGKKVACQHYQDQFYDEAYGWSSAFRQALELIKPSAFEARFADRSQAPALEMRNARRKPAPLE